MGALPDRLPDMHTSAIHTRMNPLKSVGLRADSDETRNDDAANGGSSASRKTAALYVVGANPLTHFDAFGVGRGKLDLLIVHEMFLTETAKVADIVFPATSAYEKRRHGYQHFG